MIGTIGSLVQETSRKRWFFATSLYTLACLAASTLLGTLLGLAGHGLRGAIASAGFHSPVPHLTVLIIGLLALVYAASDLGLFELPRPILMPAVPVWWWRRWQPYGASVLYGAALGLGVMTRIWFGAFYVVCACAVLGGDWRYGALLLGTYGLARALVMFPASWGISCHRDDVVGWLSSSLFDLERAQRIMAAALIVFGVLVLAGIALPVAYLFPWW